MQKIVLVGYMGSGKTEIGKLLSKKVNLPFYDLDFLIEKELGKSVATIFLEKGEIYFRKIEHQLLLEQMNKEEGFVLSLGGGTPCYANNHEAIQADGVIAIYLKASITTLVTRLYTNRSKRPLIKDLTAIELEEFIAKHLFERSFYYNQSKHIITVDNKTPDEIVEAISVFYSK